MKGLENGLMLAMAMIILVVGMIFVLTLPSYFSSTHKVLLALMILLGGGFILSMAMK